MKKLSVIASSEILLENYGQCWGWIESEWGRVIKLAAEYRAVSIPQSSWVSPGLEMRWLVWLHRGPVEAGVCLQSGSAQYQVTRPRNRSPAQPPHSGIIFCFVSNYAEQYTCDISALFRPETWNNQYLKGMSEYSWDYSDVGPPD